MLPWVRPALAVTLVLAAAPVVAAHAGPPSPGATIQVLSNRADLISGGDALVRVTGAERLTVNGRAA
jgi:hypothetical protein